MNGDVRALLIKARKVFLNPEHHFVMGFAQNAEGKEVNTWSPEAVRWSFAGVIHRLIWPQGPDVRGDINSPENNLYQAAIDVMGYAPYWAEDSYEDLMANFDRVLGPA